MEWRYKHTVLTLCTLAFFATMVARLAISPVVPLITDDFAIGNTAVGVALTGMWMSYAATQFPSGILGDRFGERSIILVSIGGTAVASVLLSFAPLFTVFVVSVVALGAVAGLHYSVATTLLGRTYENIGFAIGVHAIGSSAAGLVAPTAAAWIGVRYGWRPAVAFTAVIAAPIFVLFAWRVHPTPPRRPDQPLHERLQLGEVASILGTPQIAFTVAIAALCTFVWQGTASFLPAFLVEHRGQSAALAGVVFSAYFAIQSIAKPGIGALSDRYGRDTATAGCTVTSIVGLGLFVAVPGAVGVVGGVLLTGIGLSWAVAVEPRFMDHMTERERGAGFGLVRTVYIVIGAFGPVVVGLLADVFGWASSFGFLVILLALVTTALVVNRVLGLGL